VGFAYTKGMLPPAIAGPIDGVLKKKSVGPADSNIYQGSPSVSDDQL
jgi:hypothetical protein